LGWVEKNRIGLGSMKLWNIKSEQNKNIENEFKFVMGWWRAMDADGKRTEILCNIHSLCIALKIIMWLLKLSVNFIID